MSDLSSIRSRRRNRLNEDSYGTDTYSAEPQFSQDTESEKYHGFQTGFFAPISTVLNSSSATLWNSAQEALSSFQPPEFPTSASFSSFASIPQEGPEPEDTVIEFICFGREEYPPANMPSRDRTAEFRTTAKSYQMRLQGNGLPPQHKNQILNDSMQFNQIARRIGRDLLLTCAQMERLAELAKKKSLFSESGEVETLSRDIKQSVTGLNKQIASLQEYSRRRNGQVPGKQVQGHSNLVVVGLQSKLANVSKDFQTVLEVRTETLKAQKSRREKFSVAEPVPSTLPSSSSTPNVRSRLLEDDIAAGGSVALDMDTLQQHSTQTQLVAADQSTHYAQARSNMMEAIEGSLSELGQIFTQLATLVSEQGEMIERIDSNVEDTAINIESAHTELVKYFHNISQNRWLMIKVFGVLIVFFIIFVLFLT